VGKLYDTDLSDAAWALIEPHLPAAKPGGRPRRTCLRAVVNAIFYLLRTGCQWRLLPRGFPPRSTVFHYYAARGGMTGCAPRQAGEEQHGQGKRGS
jgi:transposase